VNLFGASSRRIHFPAISRLLCKSDGGTRKGSVMANTSSAKKAARQAVKRTAVNKMRTTRMRNVVRKAEEALVSGDAKLASVAVVAAESAMMKAAQSGTLHKNTASRKASRLSKRVKALSA
jgi:small subunit ribosomal protein S20